MNSDPPSALRPPPSDYDALLLISFGGPEGPDDVMPFLENVVCGKDVPRERLRAVARQYESFGGCSPANDQSRALLTALVGELNAHGPRLPVYWGNRNWHPLLADAVGQMAEDDVHHALAFVTSAFGSYPTCRQYLEDIERARAAVGPDAPKIDKLRLFYNHPGFVEATAERVAEALREVPPERRDRAKLIYTAHSIPAALAERSPYEHQLRKACRLVTENVKQKEEWGKGEDWQLVLSEPERAALAALAGSGYRRARSPIAGCRARGRAGCRADRLPHGTQRDDLRPRRGSRPALRRIGDQPGTGRHGRQSSAAGADDPRTGRRAPRSHRAAAGVGCRRSLARSVSGRVLLKNDFAERNSSR